jgi:flagellar hook-associated protein 1 FlgK
MVVSVALNNALTGIRAAQTTINTIADNVSNANTEGYTRKTAPLQSVTGGGNIGAGVTSATIQRRVDELLNRDIRRESSTLGSSDVTTDYLERIQKLIGSTQSGGTVNTAVGMLQSAMNALAVSPSDPSLQQAVANAANNTALTLNRVEGSFQDMRSQADSEIATAVQTVNQNLQNIQSLNSQIARANALGEPIGGLQDQRDLAIATVAQYIGIQTFTREDGETVVYTARGRALVDGVATELSYTPAASSAASSTPFSLITIGADKQNITNDLTSGKLQALIQMRDQTLPELSRELNVIARGLYDQTFAPPAVPTSTIQAVGNLSSAAATNSFVDVTYTGDYALHDSNGVAFNATLRFVKTAVPNEWRIEINSLTRQSDGGVPVVAVPPAAGATLTAGAPLQLGTFDASTQKFDTIPATGATGSLTLPVMTMQVGSEPASFLGDAGPPAVPPTFAFDLNQLTGTSAATSVQALNNRYRLFQGINIIDPTVDNAATIKLNAFFDNNAGGTPGNLFVAGDRVPSVTQRMATKLAAAIDTSRAPYSSIGATLAAGQVSLVQYANALLAHNSIQAADAKNTNDFQSKYVAALQQQSASISGVNVDEELANLQVFQTAYQAAARVLQAADAILQTLLEIR